jgi:hypothetical protein
MQSRGKLIIPLAIAFLFALNLSGLDQATPPNPGTATNPSTSQPAQSPAGSYQSGIGTTTPNSIPAQPPNNVNPGVTPNSNVIPSSTLPDQNPNLVPNPYPNPNGNSTSIQPGIGTTSPNSIPEQPPNTTTPNSSVILTPNPNFTPNSNVIPSSTLPNQNPNLVPNPYPNTVPFSNVNPGATNPNVTPGTQPNNSSGTLAPVGTAVPGTGSSPPIGAGAPGASPPLACSRVQAWQCLE